jgi:predicted acetyltransferase
MQPDIRRLVPDELDAFAAMLETAAGRPVSAAALADTHTAYEPGRMLGVFDRGQVVAGTGSAAIELTVPGPVTVPAAKGTLMGVLPTHRHRGLMTALVRAQVRDLGERGEVITVVTTTVTGPGGRFGYSPASVSLGIEVEPGRDRRAADDRPAGRVCLLDAADFPDVLPGVFDAHRRIQPGQVSRPDHFWRMWFHDREVYRIGPGERFAVRYEDGAGRTTGYLTYRLRQGELRERPVRALVVEDLIAVTEPARRALWRYCLGFDQAAVVTAWNVPADEPLAWMLADPRRVRVTRMRDFLWVRLVDVPRALAARRYAVPGELVLEVHDPVLTENAGRYRLRGDPDTAQCAPTTAAADIELTVTELAAVYLGATSFTALARAGRVTELTAGALVRASAMFASYPAPWTVTDW